VGCAMKPLILTLLLLAIPSLGAAAVPTDAQLEAEVQQLIVPRVEARLKAQATAYRIYEETARHIGLRTKTAYVRQQGGVELAALTPR